MHFDLLSVQGHAGVGHHDELLARLLVDADERLDGGGHGVEDDLDVLLQDEALGVGEGRLRRGLVVRGYQLEDIGGVTYGYAAFLVYALDGHLTPASISFRIARKHR